MPDNFVGYEPLLTWAIWEQRIPLEEDKVRENFEKLKIVPGLKEKFLKSMISDQDQFMRLLIRGSTVWDLAAYMKLSEITQSPDLTFYISSLSTGIPESLTKGLSVAFEKSLDRCLKFHAGFPGVKDESLYLYEYCIILLNKIYGDTRMIEVLNQWSINTMSSELYDLMILVERWDEFKEYPVDWSLNVIGVRSKQNEISE